MTKQVLDFPPKPNPKYPKDFKGWKIRYGPGISFIHPDVVQMWCPEASPADCEAVAREHHERSVRQNRLWYKLRSPHPFHRKSSQRMAGK